MTVLPLRGVPPIAVVHHRRLTGPPLRTRGWASDDDARVAARFSGRAARSYDRRARAWDTTVARRADLAIVGALAPLADGPPLSVLDIGAGVGGNLRRLDRARVPVERYLGLDAAGDMVAEATRRHHADRRATFRAPAEAPSATGDLVLLTWVLSQTPDPAALLDHALGRVAHDGVLVVAAVTTPARGAAARAALWALQGRSAARPVPRRLLVDRSPASVETALGGLFTVTSHRRRP